jgi:deazaflavin-dependent oxidoreductase (nitroreductase family)
MDQSSSSDATHPGLSKKAYLWFESLILEKLVPLNNPGPVFHWIFKFPLLLDRLGLWFLIPKGILILTTTGRRSKKLRRTPMEYGSVSPDGSYIVMSGWSGHTDWYRNALADPHVNVKIGNKLIPAIATPLEDEEIAGLLHQVIEFNPASLLFFERWSGPLDPSAEGLRKAARYFPSLRLKVI